MDEVEATEQMLGQVLQHIASLKADIRREPGLWRTLRDTDVETVKTGAWWNYMRDV